MHASIYFLRYSRFPKTKGKTCNLLTTNFNDVKCAFNCYLWKRSIKKFGKIISKNQLGGAQIAHQKTISVYYKHQADKRYIFIIMLHYFMCCKYRSILLSSRNVKYLNYSQNMTARADNDEGNFFSWGISRVHRTHWWAIKSSTLRIIWVYKSRRCISTGVDDRRRNHSPLNYVFMICLLYQKKKICLWWVCGSITVCFSNFFTTPTRFTETYFCVLFFTELCRLFCLIGNN